MDEYDFIILFATMNNMYNFVFLNILTVYIENVLKTKLVSERGINVEEK